MKKLTVAQFGEKTKILNEKDQKKIKGGYKYYSRPFSTKGSRWIEIDIRREASTSGKAGTLSIKN